MKELDPEVGDILSDSSFGTLYEDGDDIPDDKKVGDVKKEAYTTYGLRYSEFISPLIKAVQELSTEVETLKTKVASLEAS